MRWLWESLARLCQSFRELLNWFYRPFNDSFRIIELIAILIAITAFFLDLGNRQEEREARAWQLLTTKASGNSGKAWSLEYLNREQHWPLFPKWWPLNKDRIPLEGIDLTPLGLARWENKPTDERTFQENDCQRRTYLRGVELSNAQLQFAVLVCCDLAGADLKKANLREADLRGADFGAIARVRSFGAEAIFRFQGANLEGAILHGADLRGADLGVSFFSKASDGRSAYFGKAALQEASSCST